MFFQLENKIKDAHALTKFEAIELCGTVCLGFTGFCGKTACLHVCLNLHELECSELHLDQTTHEKRICEEVGMQKLPNGHKLSMFERMGELEPKMECSSVQCTFIKKRRKKKLKAICAECS